MAYRKPSILPIMYISWHIRNYSVFDLVPRPQPLQSQASQAPCQQRKVGWYRYLDMTGSWRFTLRYASRREWSKCCGAEIDSWQWTWSNRYRLVCQHWPSLPPFLLWVFFWSPLPSFRTTTLQPNFCVFTVGRDWRFYGATLYSARQRRSMSAWSMIVEHNCPLLARVSFHCSVRYHLLLFFRNWWALSNSGQAHDGLFDHEQWYVRCFWQFNTPYDNWSRFYSDYVPLVNIFGIYFQIRDDYMNLQSTQVCTTAL